MKMTMKRSLNSALAGAALALAGAALATAPAQAAGEWVPQDIGKVSYTPGVSTQVDFRYTYQGTAGNVQNLIIDVFLPDGVEWDSSNVPPTGGNGGFIRVNEQHTSSPAFQTCTVNTPKVLSCPVAPNFVTQNGAVYSGSVPIQPGNTILVRAKLIVDPAATGALDVPITANARFQVDGASSGWILDKQVATIDLPQQVDTPVIAPALAGLALLGAAGVGGVAVTRRMATKKTS